jgi:hypothetical protein
LHHLPPSNTLTSIHKETFQDWKDKEINYYLKYKILSPKLFLGGHLHKPLKTRELLNLWEKFLLNL